METSSYVSLSGQLALEKRMETIAQNIANANTPGYRATGVQFSSIISRTSPAETAFAATGASFVNEESGGLTQTGSPLDLAVQGDGYFAYESPQGVFYSRDGRLTATAEGQLASLSGHPILDSGGGQIVIDPQGGPISVAKNGAITQDGNLRGRIGIFSVDTTAGFTRFENSGIIPQNEAEAITTFSSDGVMQGYLEQSNVNPITEMVRMIQVTRAFEATSNLAERAHDAERAAIQAFAAR
jgi:flagellar basal-body rod protein FlgF